MFVLRHGQALLVWSWCFIQPMFLASSGWLNWVDLNASVDTSRALNMLLMMIPAWTVLSLIELGRFVGFANHESKIEAQSKIGMFKKTYLLWACHSWLIPFGAALLVAGIADSTVFMSKYLPGLGLYGTIAIGILFSLFVTLLSPNVFVRLIGANSVDPSIEVLVSRMWKLGGSSVPKILLWPTGGRVANAAVVGMIAYARKLLLTDALLQRLTDRELEMVVLHELAHCARYHAWIRTLPTLGTVCLLLLAMNSLSGFLLSAVCFVLFVAFLCSLVSVSWWTELDADRVAIQLGNRRGSAPGDSKWELVSALRKIYGEGNLKRWSWMHPSCHRRIQAIACGKTQTAESAIEFVQADV